MSASLILDLHDMERTRRPDELYSWVMAKCDELGATSDSKAFSRLGALLPKKFYDEFYPLALFVKREFSGRDDISVKPHLGNDNFDAQITFNDKASAIGRTIFVEITYAKDGYDESRRMEILSRDGHVNWTGPVSSSGRKRSSDRNVHVKNEANSHLAALKKHFAIVKKRLQDKTLPRRYGKDHVLVVAVDDYLILRNSSNVDQFRDAVTSWLPALPLDFCRVVFVGASGQLFESFAVTGLSSYSSAR